MFHRKLLGKITIENYIRKVSLSNAQRPKYYQWDGITIKSGSKKLLQKYIYPAHKDDIIRNDGNIKPCNLKPEYQIIGFKKDRIYSVITPLGTERTQILTTAQMKPATVYILCETTDTVNNKGEYEIGFKKVIANETQAGRPKEHIINGQAFYNQTLSPFARIKVVETIKKAYYHKFNTITSTSLQGFRKLISLNYPIFIEMEIVDTVKSIFDTTKEGDGRRWDVGNRAEPYMKCYLDFLVNGYTVTNKDDSITTLLEPLLEDDDRLHLSSGNNSFFTPIKEGETRKLVFYIYKDTRPIWKQFLKS